MGNTFYTEWKNEKMHLCNMFKNIMIWLWNLLQYFANKVEKNTCQQMIFHVYWITLWHTSEDTEGCGIQQTLCMQVFLRSDVQFKKPGDMVTVLNIGKRLFSQGKVCVSYVADTSEWVCSHRLSCWSSIVRKGGDFFYG